MRIVYSQLKKLLPVLDKPVREVANDLTMLGHFVDGIYEDHNETVISLEIRQNRGDCLGYWGIARDLAVFYNLELKYPDIDVVFADQPLPIKIEADGEVKRVQAVSLHRVKNKPTPDWLKKFLLLHDINSINTIVDLTNFIMLWYGIPCHAFDTEKSSKNFSWEHAKEESHMTTLDGTNLVLDKETLIIANNNVPTCLTMIGGKDTAIELKTEQIFLEMAVYDRVRVRKDAKKLKIVTEAGIRLEKDLDCELIPMAFKNLVNIIQKECGGEVNSQLFDYYPNKQQETEISFNPNKPSLYSGIDIPKEFALDCLKRLGCRLKQNKAGYLVAPPSIRKDINLEEDLIEEVIRFYGYNKIPVNQPITRKQFTDITPKILYFINQLKNILVEMGYDEIRSWPLIEKEFYLRNTGLPVNTQAIYTQNNINENYPLLRSSIISSLVSQQKQYQRFKVTQNQFFEIGKVFYRSKVKYCEHYALGLYHNNSRQLYKDIKILADKLKVTADNFQKYAIGEDIFYEVNLDKLLSKKPFLRETLLNSPKESKAIAELTKQIITLDANVVLQSKVTPATIFAKYQKAIGEEKLWQIEITDIFEQKNFFKYTLRVSYYNLTDKQAKQIHLSVFKLS